MQHDAQITSGLRSRLRGSRLLALFGAATVVLGGCQDLLETLADGGVGMDGGAGTGGSGGGGPFIGCGLGGEPEPNDTRTQATPYAAGTSVAGCLAAMGDVDFYETTAPAGNAAGGFYQGAITDVGAGTVDVKVYTASDNAPLLQSTFTIDAGASLFFYWAAAPGQTYRIAVSPFNPFTGAFLYKWKATYTPVTDAYEPNDTREQAKPIAVGTPIDALFFAGHKRATVAIDEFKDFYAFDLAAGMVTLKVDRVPSMVRPEVELYDGAGNRIGPARMFNNTPGGSINVSTTVAKGPHRLEVRIFSLAPETAKNAMAVPDNFTQPYRLTVSQP
jgi:hypothetical protein